VIVVKGNLIKKAVSKLDEDREFQLELTKLQTRRSVGMQLFTLLMSSALAITVISLTEKIHGIDPQVLEPLWIIAFLFILLAIVIYFSEKKALDEWEKKIRRRYIKTDS
jgi:uncharacterized membrane protein